MDRPDWKAALGEALEHAVAYLEGLPDRPVRPAADLAQLRAALGGPLPDGPQRRRARWSRRWPRRPSRG